MKIPRFNLANRITLLRLALAIACFGCFIVIIRNEMDWHARSSVAFIATIFFVAGTALDALDGYIARRDNLVTAFGRIADPFVDKILVCGGLVFLLDIPEAQDFLKTWMVVVILSREFFVTGIRGYFESNGIDFSAVMPGKIKMVVQSLAIGFLMGLMWIKPNPTWLVVSSHVLVWATVASTVYSGLVYLRRAAKELQGHEL